MSGSKEEESAIFAVLDDDSLGHGHYGHVPTSGHLESPLDWSTHDGAVLALDNIQASEEGGEEEFGL